MSSFGSWYSRWYDCSFLKVQGGRPSELFTRYFSKGNVEYLGKVKRKVFYKFKECVNSSFSMFINQRNIEAPTQYRMVERNLDACYLDASKYDADQPSLEIGAWEMAGSWVARRYHTVLNGSREMTHNEVVDSMDMTTSCGYPHNILYHNKREMSQTKDWTILPEYWDMISVGTFTDGTLYSPDRVMPIFCVAQKVELRKVEKLRLNKIRTFTAAPVEHSYATNRLCLDFNIRFYNSASKARILGTSSFVGATKFLQGWDILHARLSRHGDANSDEFRNNAFELDETRYDSSLSRAMMFGQCELRWEMMRQADKTPENRVRLWNVYEALVDTVMVLEDGNLIQKHTGNPSGSSNTIVDNTLILERLFCYAFILLSKEQGLKPTYEYYRDNVEAAMNGDDNTYTCSNAVVKWFDPINVGRIWTAIGVTTKTPCETPRKVEECSFLSNGFVYDDTLGIYLPCPSRERVLSSVMYGSAVDDVRWHLLRASALRIDSYGNKEVRDILSEYIAFITTNYQDELVGECEGIPIKEIIGIWKDERWIRALYSGNEGVGNNTGMADRLLKLL